MQQEHAHDWPLVVRVASGVQRRHHKDLLAGDPPEERNCVMELDWWAARVKAIGGTWNIVVGDRPVTAEHELLSFARRIVPAYLHDICRRGLNLDHWNAPLESYVAEVLRDLARFVEQRGGDPQTVLAAREIIWPAGQPQAGAFVDLVTRLTWEGDLDVAADDDLQHRWRAVIEVPEANGLFLSHATLAKLLRGKGVDTPAHDQVTRALADAGTLIEDRGDGWLFQRAWIEEQERRLCEDDRNLLRAG